jgi:hypothetical protein
MTAVQAPQKPVIQINRLLRENRSAAQPHSGRVIVLTNPLIPRIGPRLPTFTPRARYIFGQRIEMVSFSLESTKAAEERAKTVYQRRRGFADNDASSVNAHLLVCKGRSFSECANYLKSSNLFETISGILLFYIVVQLAQETSFQEAVCRPNILLSSELGLPV